MRPRVRRTVRWCDSALTVGDPGRAGLPASRAHDKKRSLCLCASVARDRPASTALFNDRRDGDRRTADPNRNTNGEASTQQCERRVRASVARDRPQARATSNAGARCDGATVRRCVRRCEGATVRRRVPRTARRPCGVRRFAPAHFAPSHCPGAPSHCPGAPSHFVPSHFAPSHRRTHRRTLAPSHRRTVRASTPAASPPTDAGAGAGRPGRPGRTRAPGRRTAGRRPGPASARRCAARPAPRRRAPPPGCARPA